MIIPEGVVTSLIDALRAVVRGNVDINLIGAGLRLAEGANARMGASGVMAAGTKLVANTSVTANTRIFLQHIGTNVANLGHLYVSARVAGVSFTITSSNGADTDDVRYLMIEPL